MIRPLLQDDAFLNDIADARGDDASDDVNLWWLGQSGYLVQHRGRFLLLDPYLSDSLTKKYAGTDKPHVRMTERVIAPEKLGFVDVITSTHNHTDHLDAQTIVPIVRAAAAPPRRSEVSLVLPAANVEFATERLREALPPFVPMRAGQTERVKEFEFTAIRAAHDRLETDARGLDLYLGYLVRVGPVTIYHSGDTIVYEGMRNSLHGRGIDIAILPINGKVGNMNGADAARLAFDIGAGLAIPCHYDLFEFNTASPQELFVPECERLGQKYKVLQAGERWTVRAT